MRSVISFIVLSAVALIMCSCGRIVSLTLVQYNVGVFDKYDSSSVETVADIIKMMRADVVTLNEVDSCTVRTGKVDQIVSLAHAMGDWSHHYASAMPFGGGAYGVGVVSRPDLKVLCTDKVALPRGNGYEPRVMAVVEYKDFIVATVHLDLTPESRMAQIQVVNDYFDRMYKDAGKPIFLAGDFNATPDSQLMAMIQESWTLLSADDCTYPSHAPDRCIDYIFVRPVRHSIKIKPGSSALPAVDLSAASDHLPVKVTAMWR